MSRTLNGLSSSSALSYALIKPYNLADVPDKTAARTNLGLVGSVSGGYYVTMQSYNGTSNSVINLNVTTSGEGGKIVALDNSGNLTCVSVSGNGSAIKMEDNINLDFHSLNNVGDINVTNMFSNDGAITLQSDMKTYDQWGKIFCNNFDTVENYGLESHVDGVYAISFNNNNVSDVGTVTAGYFVGNGSELTSFTASQIPALNANKITTGTFVTSLIPTLDYNKVTSAGGVFNANYTAWWLGNGISPQFAAGSVMTFASTGYVKPSNLVSTMPYDRVTIRTSGIYALNVRFQVDPQATGTVVYTVYLSKNTNTNFIDSAQEQFNGNVGDYRLNNLTFMCCQLAANDVLICYVQTATNCRVRALGFSGYLVAQTSS